MKNYTSEKFPNDVRKPGYYWVMLEGVWTVAMWHVIKCNGKFEGSWNWFTDQHFKDENFDEIDEQMIVRK